MNTNNIYQLASIKKLVDELGDMVSKVSEEAQSPLYWSGSVADFVELVYGLIETRRLNEGCVELKFAAEYLSVLVNCPVKDCYDTFRAIRRRVDSRTLLLDEMKETLEKRMEDLDNGKFKKKRYR